MNRPKDKIQKRVMSGQFRTLAMFLGSVKGKN